MYYHFSQWKKKMKEHYQSSCVTYFPLYVYYANNIYKQNIQTTTVVYSVIDRGDIFNCRFAIPLANFVSFFMHSHVNLSSQGLAGIKHETENCVYYLVVHQSIIYLLPLSTPMCIYGHVVI